MIILSAYRLSSIGSPKEDKNKDGGVTETPGNDGSLGISLRSQSKMVFYFAIGLLANLQWSQMLALSKQQPISWLFLSHATFNMERLSIL